MQVVVQVLGIACGEDQIAHRVDGHAPRASLLDLPEQTNDDASTCPRGPIRCAILQVWCEALRTMAPA